MPGRRTAHHNDPVPGRQTLKDDMIPGHPLVIDDEDDELTQQSSDQILNSVWNVGMQVRVVDDDLEPKIRCAGWMAVKDNIASGDILAHAVAESELDDGLAMEEPARRARLGGHLEKHHVFRFGKYRNERYEDVTEESPDYYFWSSQERKPSKYLQHYLDWVTEHYVVDPVRSTLTSKVTGRILEAKPSTTKGQKQTESQLKSLRQEGWKQTTNCVTQCDPRHATRAGSNATHVRLTCLQCGTVTQTKREETLVKSPETCQHVATDSRGSSSATHRVYCKDCGQYVYECPQSEWRQEQNEIRGNWRRGRTERIDFSRGGERVTRAEVSELIHSFPQALRLFLRQRPDEEFDLHQIEQVLQDCVDLIRETAEAGRASSSATLENTITAFVACALVSMTSTSTLQGRRRTIDDEENRAVPSAFPARAACAKRQTPMFRSDAEERHEKRLVRSLPQPTSTMTRIDLKTDPRVFAVLDDGCNHTCHTPAFIDHMRAVLESEGKELSPLVGEAKHYTGIGGCRATGRRSIPFGLALPEGSSVRAVLMSNEPSIGTERIMLLSIKARATLGLVKDTRSGTCFLKDYGQFAPLYEVVGSDLRCVCISDWQADRPDAKVLGPDESGNFEMKTETMKYESLKSMREERVEARSVQSDEQKNASEISNEMIEDYRRRLFRIYLQHAPEHIGKIPDLLQEHGSTKETLDALVARALWEHLAKGSGERPDWYTDATHFGNQQ